MNVNRQTLLYGGLALCALVFGGDWAYRQFYETPLNELAIKRDDLQKELDKRRHDLTRAKKTAKVITAWNQQSLPSNVDVARSLYRAWLIEQVEHAGIVSPNVDSGSPASRRGLFQSLPFSMRGRATLEQLTRFLYAFYRANHLHQIQSLGITPFPGSNQLDVSISIEAVILPDADRPDRLASGTSDSWTARSFKDYRTIVRRDLFAAGGGLDPVALTYLSGITAVNGRFQAWFDLRAENRTLKLNVGDPLEVGVFQGRVVEIGRRDVTLESEGQRWLLSIGENLDQGFGVPRIENAPVGIDGFSALK